MPDQDTLYPLEFFALATPVSAQGSAKSKERWGSTIKTAVRARILQTDELAFLDHRPLAVTIYYFSAAPMQGDIDNIVKPILDAMINIAYFDDRSVERVVCQKFEPQLDWGFIQPSDQLAAASNADPPAVYVKVDDDLSWRRL